MITLFKENSAASVLAVIVISFLVHVHFADNPTQVLIKPEEGLAFYILQPLNQLPPLALSVIYQLIILIQAFRFNYLMNDLRMFPKQGNTTALAYVLLTALFPEWGNLSVALVSNSAVLWFLYFITRSFNAAKPRSLVFNAGLMAALAALLNYTLLPLSIVAFFGLAIIRPFRVKEWFVLLLGLLTPFYFTAGYLFIAGKSDATNYLLNIFEWHIIVPKSLLHTIITTVTTGIIIAAGIYMSQSNSSRMMLQVRKSWAIIFWMFLFLVPAIFFIKDDWPATLLPLTVPSTAFISYALLQPRRNFVPLIFFWLLVAVTVYNNWFA